MGFITMPPARVGTQFYDGKGPSRRKYALARLADDKVYATRIDEPAKEQFWPVNKWREMTGLEIDAALLAAMPITPPPPPPPPKTATKPAKTKKPEKAPKIPEPATEAPAPAQAEPQTAKQPCIPQPDIVTAAPDEQFYKILSNQLCGEKILYYNPDADKDKVIMTNHTPFKHGGLDYVAVAQFADKWITCYRVHPLTQAPDFSQVNPEATGTKRHMGMHMRCGFHPGEQANWVVGSDVLCMLNPTTIAKDGVNGDVMMEIISAKDAEERAAIDPTDTIDANGQQLQIGDKVMRPGGTLEYTVKSLVQSGDAEKIIQISTIGASGFENRLRIPCDSVIKKGMPQPLPPTTPPTTYVEVVKEQCRDGGQIIFCKPAATFTKEVTAQEFVAGIPNAAEIGVTVKNVDGQDVIAIDLAKRPEPAPSPAIVEQEERFIGYNLVRQQLFANGTQDLRFVVGLDKQRLYEPKIAGTRRPVKWKTWTEMNDSARLLSKTPDETETIRNAHIPTIVDDMTDAEVHMALETFMVPDNNWMLVTGDDENGNMAHRMVIEQEGIATLWQPNKKQLLIAMLLGEWGEQPFEQWVQEKQAPTEPDVPLPDYIEFDGPDWTGRAEMHDTKNGNIVFLKRLDNSEWKVTDAKDSTKTATVQDLSLAKVWARNNLAKLADPQAEAARVSAMLKAGRERTAAEAKPTEARIDQLHWVRPTEYISDATRDYYTKLAAKIEKDPQKYEIQVWEWPAEDCPGETHYSLTTCQATHQNLRAIQQILKWENVPISICERTEEPFTAEKDGRKFVGHNGEGKALYEDKRGVRSYVEDGWWRTEAVSMIPTAGPNGKTVVEIGTDRLAHPDYKSFREIIDGQKTYLPPQPTIEAATATAAAQPEPEVVAEPPLPLDIAALRKEAFGHWGWEQEYSDFFLEKIAQTRSNGKPIPVLFACAPDALPSIHSWKKEDGVVDHMGFGCFYTKRPGFYAVWDAGGAMDHHGEISYTTVNVEEGEMPDWYNVDAVKLTLLKLKYQAEQFDKMAEAQAAYHAGAAAFEQAATVDEKVESLTEMVDAAETLLAGRKQGIDAEAQAILDETRAVIATEQPAPPPFNKHARTSDRDIERRIKQLDKDIKQYGQRMEGAYEMAIYDKGESMRVLQVSIDAFQQERQELRVEQMRREDERKAKTAAPAPVIEQPAEMPQAPAATKGPIINIMPVGVGDQLTTEGMNMLVDPVSKPPAKPYDPGRVDLLFGLGPIDNPKKIVQLGNAFEFNMPAERREGYSRVSDTLMALYVDLVNPYHKLRTVARSPIGYTGAQGIIGYENHVDPLAKDSSYVDEKTSLIHSAYFVTWRANLEGFWRIHIAYEYGSDTYTARMWRALDPATSHLVGEIVHEADQLMWEDLRDIVDSMYDRAAKDYCDGFMPDKPVWLPKINPDIPTINSRAKIRH